MISSICRNRHQTARETGNKTNAFRLSGRKGEMADGRKRKGLKITDKRL